MSLETISIRKRLPIINGFVQVPNADNSNLTDVTVAEAEVLIVGSDNIDEFFVNPIPRDRLAKRQQLELPSFLVQDLYPDDFYQDLNDSL